MNNYYNKKIVIIGMGITGISCLNFFLSKGIRPFLIIDENFSQSKFKNIPRDIKCHFGKYNNQYLLMADLIIISPGIQLNNPIIHQAITYGIEVIGDVELFCREAKAPIIAITGSNGKSTVTTLLSSMASLAKLKIGIGGNIGLPVLNLLQNPVDLYILELSSFQLETTYSLKTLASCILNITEEHMDRYPLGINEYRSAKLRIYNNCSTCVINADDPLTIPINNKSKKCISFGINKADYQLIHKYRQSWLQIKGKKILNVNKMILLGNHNYLNALAALALADVIGLPIDLNIQALTQFTGLSHRFQLVHYKNNISWINDSKSTNVDSTKVALESIKINGTLWLLLGGNGKSANFKKLLPYLLKINKIKIYCFGKDAYILSRLIPDKSYLVDTMYQAMLSIVSQVKPGDIVLLSPACSSIDQFDNFEQRGELFTKLAKELY